MSSDTESLLDNDTLANASNATLSGRAAASFEGLMTAYTALLLMAVVPIYVGSLRSIAYHANLKSKGETAQDNISARDAMFYPIYASVALFGLYIFFKFVPKEYVNIALGIFFFIVCVAGLARLAGVLLDPLLFKVFGSRFPEYKFSFTKKASEESSPAELFVVEFTASDILVFLVSCVIGIWHLVTKHWLLNNTFGLAFSVNAIEMVSLNNIKAGFILLGGLFLYDIFWVFGTDVMVTVAQSLEAPIKLTFPMDFLEHGVFGSNFSMLGLGDIVIPGIFIALLCRFDHRVFQGRFRLYFHACFVAYIIGLVTTVVCLHFYQAAQPALLYLVPSCLGIPSVIALLKGDLTAMLQFEDYPDTSAAKKEEEKSD